MAKTLVLNVPDAIYAALVHSAERAGATPEALAIECLAAVSRRGTDDPLEAFIGAFRTDVPGWPERHDELLGQSILNKTGCNPPPATSHE